MPGVSRRIRIVHCISDMRVGGAELQLAELITRLPPERFEQRLVLLLGGALSPASPARTELLGRVRAAGCPVVELEYGGWDGGRVRRGFEFGAVIHRYRRELIAFRPDIVHGQLFWSDILSVAAGRLASVPVIITSRLALSRPGRERAWKRYARDLANVWTTGIFANSEAVRRDILAHERVRPEAITVIPNGIALEKFAPAITKGLRPAFGVADEDLVLATIGNLRRLKGHEDLLRAIHLVKGKYPRLRLLVVGRDAGMRSQLEQLIVELGLPDHVRLLGERSDVARVLSLADVVVQPSHEEGFSNAVLEAMACGRPLVATNVGGNPEAVRDGVDGLLVPARNPAALADAVDRLASAPELRERMGRNGRRRVESEFSMARMVERFAEWYEVLCRRAGVGHAVLGEVAGS
jgi:glycosyltransferase involved in cell wall biosynthesis